MRALGTLSVLAVAVAVVLAIVSRPALPEGDACEYAQMTHSLANHGSPELRLEDLRPLLPRCPRLWPFILEPTLPPAFGPYVQARNHHYYPYHFWGYSLFAVPAALALRPLAADPWAAFPLLNGVMLIGALTCIAVLSPLPPYHRMALVALTAGSPALWFLRWPHPEVFCYALVTVALVVADRQGWVWAAVLIATASWQAPPLIVVLAWFVARAARHRPRAMILAGLCGGAVALVPVTFSLWSFGTPSILAQRAASASFISGQRILDLLVDPNIGMWPYAPVTLSLFVGVAVWTLAVRRTLSLPVQALAVLVIMMALASSTNNWNHGTAGPSRYVIWMLPLVFHGVVSIRTPSGSGWRVGYGLALVASVITQAGVIVALGAMTPRLNYLELSPLARLVLRTFPALYTPSPEIFLERTRHAEGPSAFGVAFHKRCCRKGLVSARDLSLLEEVCGTLPEAVKRRIYTNPPDAPVYVDFPKGVPVATITAPNAAVVPWSLGSLIAHDARCDAQRRTPCDAVTVEVSRRIVRPGDRLSATITVRPVPMTEAADLHVGVTLPDRSRVFRDPAGRMAISHAPYGLSPAERSGPISAAGGASVLRRFDIEIGPELAAGPYEVFAAVVRRSPGAEGDVEIADIIAWDLRTVMVNHRPSAVANPEACP